MAGSWTGEKRQGAELPNITLIVHPSEVTTQRREQDLSILANLNLRLSIIFVLSYTCICIHSRVLGYTQHVEELIHLRWHIWLEQDGAYPKRIRAEENDAVQLLLLLRLGKLPRCTELHVCIRLRGQSKIRGEEIKHILETPLPLSCAVPLEGLAVSYTRTTHRLLC